MNNETNFDPKPCSHCGENDMGTRIDVYCKPCRRAYAKARRELGKDAAYLKQSDKDYRLEIKKRYVDHAGGKCNRCGFTPTKDAHYSVFHFHHPNRDREITVAGSYSRRWEVMKVEIERCELLCSNCHIVEHYRDGTRAGRPRHPIDKLTAEFMELLKGK